MSYFEFRQYVESAVPWWAPFAVPISLLLFYAVINWWRHQRKRK